MPISICTVADDQGGQKWKLKTRIEGIHKEDEATTCPWTAFSSYCSVWRTCLQRQGAIIGHDGSRWTHEKVFFLTPQQPA